ncbi:kinase-like domain-containing protein [Phyllosticta capitalensis]
MHPSDRESNTGHKPEAAFCSPNHDTEIILHPNTPDSPQCSMNARESPIPSKTACRLGTSFDGNHTKHADHTTSQSLATLAGVTSQTKDSSHCSAKRQEMYGIKIKNFARGAMWKLKRAACFKAKGSGSPMLSGSRQSCDHRSPSGANDEKYQFEDGDMKTPWDGILPQQCPNFPETFSLHPSQSRSHSSPKPSQSTHEDDIIDGCYWGSVLYIQKPLVIQLVRDHLQCGDSICASDCWVETIEQGSYNRAFIVRIGSQKYVLRVPRFGVKGVWNEHDKVELRSQALTMKWIQANLHIPIPAVLAYDVTHDNMINHPYILMSYLPGKRVCEVWHGRYGLELEEKRKKILESIAHTAAELSYFTFSKSGMFHFDNDDAKRPKVGECYELLQDDVTSSRKVLHKTRMVRPVTSSYDEFRQMLNHWWFRQTHNDEYNPQDEQSLHLLRGQREILELFVHCLPSSPLHNNEEKERFVIAPPDFNWQNILVDEEGNVTGFLDWDSTRTVSSFLGWAALPIWLCTDFTEDVLSNGSIDCSPAFISGYRQHYAQAIAKTTDGQGDSKYTQKSVLFRALVEALRCRKKTLMIIEKILQLILPRANIKQYLMHIGKEGLTADERDHLIGLINELFKCVPGTDTRFPI